LSFLPMSGSALQSLLSPERSLGHTISELMADVAQEQRIQH
jgi:hypothetical protein